MIRPILIAALLTLTASAQTPESAVNITVRLFSTQTIHSLTITPLSNEATQRTCPTCASKSIPTKLELTATTTPLTLEGQLHITAAPDKQITAAGHWQITPTPTGLKILLTLPSERYVIAALNGEAAPDEPPQSLRALAIAIRTFALTNLARHHAESFNLCDSTHCQALRFTTPRPEVEQAVRDTAGETLWFGSQPGSKRATIYYTQSCGGQTESASTVWPTEHQPYLTGHPDPYCIRRTPANWHAQITLAELATIARQQNWRLPTTIESIRITKRTPTGRAITLELAGHGQTAQLSASSLHFALDRELGWNQLRSDWYTVTLSNAALHFDGKGYGHGVGLCQTGAHQMATEGHTYREILAFYFPGTHTGIAPTDQGWLETQHPNWTLLTTTPSPSLAQSIDQAWLKAQSLFPPHTPTHPTIHQLPTTELFRQTTAEPGWVRASTQGTHIYLQPPSILSKNDAAQETILHELLHVLIEQESTDQAPLWLREGLAEALATPTPNSRSTTNQQPATNNQQLDSRLANRTNQQLAHAAQLEATQKVHLLLQHYDLTTLRTWLRTGPPPSIK
jgi:stage II sporulation protein D